MSQPKDEMILNAFKASTAAPAAPAGGAGDQKSKSEVSALDSDAPILSFKDRGDLIRLVNTDAVKQMRDELAALKNKLDIKSFEYTTNESPEIAKLSEKIQALEPQAASCPEAIAYDYSALQNALQRQKTSLQAHQARMEIMNVQQKINVLRSIKNRIATPEEAKIEKERIEARIKVLEADLKPCDDKIKKINIRFEARKSVPSHSGLGAKP